MKINKITVENILAVNQAEIETSKPIIFVSGNNEAGKSSMLDAVSMALTGQLRRVSLKKDMAQLVHTGKSSGSVNIVADDQQFVTSIKNGKLSTNAGEISYALPYVLDTHLFASQSNDERRKLLFNISNCKAGSQDIKLRIINRGVPESIANEIIPFLRSGFDAAHKEAQAKMRECKSSWRTVTGETYGEAKASAWKAKAEGNIDELRELIIDKEKELSAIDSDLDTLNQKLGAMQAGQDKHAPYADEVGALRIQAEKIERIRAKLERDEEEAKQWRVKVESAKLSTHGVSEDDTVCQCPVCDSELIFTGDKRLIEHGDQRGDEDAAAKLPDYQRSLEMLERAVANGMRDLAICQAAQAKLDALGDKEEASPQREEYIKAVSESIANKRTVKKLLEDSINNLITEERNINAADSKTKEATKYHEEVLAWSKVVEAFSPDGIPGELMQDAMAPFIKRMEATAGLAGWKLPVIDNNMNITVNGLAYGLMSESAQWRVDCLIAEAISHVSGLRLLVLDRCDVLDGKSRGVLFGWLDELASVDAIDTALVMGTLKKEQAEVVANAFENISVHWIQDGVLREIKQSKEMEAA